MVVGRLTRAAQAACLLLAAMSAPIACSAQMNNAGSVVAWERGLAESGDAIYQTKLGLRYRAGEGVEKDEVEAAKWFRAAAEQGNANAAVLLASAYWLGRGLEKNLVRSYQWYEVTITRLQPEDKVLTAVRARSELTKLMTPQQIREAVDLVAVWQPAKASRLR
jgi:hypothetical protein